MEQQNFLNEMEESKLPSTLNVLTILTFIGSGFAIFMSLISPWLLSFSKKMIDQATSMGSSQISPKDLAKMEESKQMIDMASQNITFSIIAGIAGAIACILGAVMMRKQKKDGYLIYVLGELLPVIIGFILMKSYFLKGGITSIIMGLLVPAVFIILYTLQRKHLTK